MGAGKGAATSSSTTAWTAPVWRTNPPPDVQGAKRDTYARRFYNKNFTTSGDLLGAITFWVHCQMPSNSMEDFLAALRPQSGWVEDEDYNPSLSQRRELKEYGVDFNSLIQGVWDKWQGN